MNVKGKWWSYSYFIRTKIDEGCSDTRLGAEPVPRVSGDPFDDATGPPYLDHGARIWLCQLQLTIGRLSTSCRHGLIGLILDR